MAAIIGPGATTIFSNTIATTSLAGSWYQINSNLARFAWQATLTASSAGATCGSTVVIEVSNDGVNPLATKAQTLALTNDTTDFKSDGAVLSSSMQGAWLYVRANVTSLTTSTAGSAGFPVVTVTAAAGYQGY